MAFHPTTSAGYWQPHDSREWPLSQCRATQKRLEAEGETVRISQRGYGLDNTGKETLVGKVYVWREATR